MHLSRTWVIGPAGIYSACVIVTPRAEAQAVTIASHTVALDSGAVRFIPTFGGAVDFSLGIMASAHSLRRHAAIPVTLIAEVTPGFL